MIYDVAVIGAGIIGASLAYKLSRYDLSLVVIDRENDPGDEISMANSAIVHCGQDPKEGTLKAKLNVAGAKQYEKLCSDLDIKYLKTGAFVVMVSEEQRDTFNQLVLNAKKRNIKYEIIDGKEALKQEPNLSPNTIQVLSLPDTAVICPWEVAITELQVAMKNKAEIKLNTDIKEIKKVNDHFELRSDKEVISAKYVINAAGIESDHVAEELEPNDYAITARKGEYFVLSHNAKDFVHHVIYPIPTAKGKGVLAVPTVDHNILFGPNSVAIEDRKGLDTTATGLDFVRQQISSTLSNLPYSDIIRTFAGLRPSVEGKDFIIELSKNDDHFLNLVGIDSPGIASAPGIADYALELLKLPYPLKKDYATKRENIFHFDKLNPEEKDAYIKQHPEYGKIVCRCEQISEGEIIQCIKEPLGATSVKAVKKRVRPGMGKCQGGFCEPLVVKILSEQLHKPESEILYDQPGTNILFERKKETSRHE